MENKIIENNISLNPQNINVQQTAAVEPRKTTIEIYKKRYKEDNKKKKEEEFLNIEDAKLDKANKMRKKAGISKLRIISCRFCGQAHFTRECPNAICKNCYENHITKECDNIKLCKYCNSKEHTTKFCKSNEAIQKRWMNSRLCYACGKYGHVAKTCRTLGIYYRNPWKNKKRYGYKGKRRKRYFK